MTDAQSTPSPDRAEELESQDRPREVLHWYDFLCPFCYVGQRRNGIFERHGFRVTDIPFEAHPDIPSAGRAMPTRNGSMYEFIEAEARAADLPLTWPARLPNSRMALAAAEWTRRHAPQSFPAFEKALFAAHFVLGEDLGNRETIIHHAVANGVDVEAMRDALDNGMAYEFVDRSETLARNVGVRGTPAWFVAGHLIPGLYPEEQFEQLARTLIAADPGGEGAPWALPP